MAEPLAPLLTSSVVGAPSAVTQRFFGMSLPAVYSDTEQEYAWLRQTVGVVDTGFQFAAELTGPDARRYLNAVTTGNIRDLQPGQSALGLLLNAQAHILAELLTLALDDRLLVLSHKMVAERTLATLDRFIIMDDVTLTDFSAKLASVALLGPKAPVVFANLGAAVADLAPGEHREVRLGGVQVRILRASLVGVPAWELLADRSQLPELAQQLVRSAAAAGGGPVGYEALNILRVECGVAWFGADFDDRVIPHEAALEQSHISYVKGCYTGQEIVERVRSRGHVNRRRLGLFFEGDQLPEPGTPLQASGREAGWVTSAVRSPRLGRNIGMGYLRREFHSPGTRLEWTGGLAEVTSLPFSNP